MITIRRIGLWLKYLTHDLLKWHIPDRTCGFDGASMTSTCKLCGLRILQDSGGDWFATCAPDISSSDFRIDTYPHDRELYQDTLSTRPGWCLQSDAAVSTWLYGVKGMARGVPVFTCFGRVLESGLGGYAWMAYTSGADVGKSGSCAAAMRHVVAHAYQDLQTLYADQCISNPALDALHYEDDKTGSTAAIELADETELLEVDISRQEVATVVLRVPKGWRPSGRHRSLLAHAAKDLHRGDWDNQGWETTVEVEGHRPAGNGAERHFDVYDVTVELRGNTGN